MDTPIILVLTLIAATIPFVVCIFAALNPSSRVRGVEDYYLCQRELDVDSFLKSTIGYSLQVAAIALFFSWTFSYGVRSVVVCVSWAAGYFVVAALIRGRKFESFLGTARASKGKALSNKVATIHGYVQSRLAPSSDSVRRLTVLLVAFASVLGLGGTMLTEIFYGTNFFIAAIGITNPGIVLETVIHLFILFFGLLYVLWGGYKASVLIDRFQTPIAYVAFGALALGLATFAINASSTPSAAWIVFALFLIFACLLIGRLRLLNKAMPAALWNKAISYFTFAPLILLSVGCFFVIWPRQVPENLLTALFPPVQSTLGFGIFGAMSLIVANVIWQLIDISSLQRLQSLDVEEVNRHRDNIVRAFTWIGIEAAAGWVIIVATALLLILSGFSITNDQVATVVTHFFSASAKGFSFLLPVFIFAVVVFMVSTVSGFMSALSYIARYDIAPAFNLISTKSDTLDSDQLSIARLTTLVVVIVLYALYAFFVAALGHGSIANILYAVYAFQLAITPSVLTALFLPHHKINAWAAILSTVAGICVAWWTATQATPLLGSPSWATNLGM